MQYSSVRLLLCISILVLPFVNSILTRRSGGSQAAADCPLECHCSERTSKSSSLATVTCSSLNLTSVPLGIPPTTKKLDLSENNLTWIGGKELAHLNTLRELSLKSNLIKEVDADAFLNLSQMKELTLSRNRFLNFPSGVIQPHSSIELLNLEYNQITVLGNNSVPGSFKLFTLLLGHNLMETVEEEAFGNLPHLQILELNDNRLTEVPTGLRRLLNLQELTLANNRILHLGTPLRTILPKIVYLELRGNPLQWVHLEAFAHLHHLKKLILSDVRELNVFPELNGTSSLEILRIDRCSLQVVPSELCLYSPLLKSLDLKSNKIRQLPHFTGGCFHLRNLDLSTNSIDNLEDEGFILLPNLHHLHLSRNHVGRLTAETLRGLSHLKALDLSYNNIAAIHPEAFLPVEKLEDLNLGNNFFPLLPSVGLSGVIHLKTFNNPNLKEFPGPESLTSVRTLVLSYAYHCCQFASLPSSTSRTRTREESSLQEDVIYPTDTEFDSALSTLNLTDVWPGIENFSNRGSLAEDFIRTFAAESMKTEETPFDFVDPSIEIINPHFKNHRTDIQCIPQPGPFLPCRDLFDFFLLRCGVWIVFLLALMGNGMVVFVLIFARTKMDVPRFLVCNLAIADFFMGVYLGFLAVVDSASMGEFRRYAIPWQMSAGCQMAGFLGVLSSELSVYTLAVITMERHYAITHAMHLNKRLSLRHAAYIMGLGWTFSLLMAVLPLFGISDYRKFAVCLPFEIGDGLSLSYVVFLMFANGVAFTILMGCYLKMYCSIRGSQAWNSNDTRIAKRMALLVFTDLLCWFPIAFFSLTAVFGLQLISLEEAKVFTVFILPLNSCCNPFLYAILTKQFKKDCVLICKAIEESRVTRGIGRCRNSSNFSNRQTAPNTGSLVEKSSKDGQPCICHSGLHPGRGDVNGNAKYRFIPAPERWSRYGPLGRFISRYILRQNNSKEANRQARDDYRMRNVRRYLYNTASATNFQADGEKHQRHASVSSDNFSSSRSDSWRAQGRCGIPLRLLEPRRRNSWAVTRKPSQDSNLSSSRNDSSGTSNSTATWQMSRSSVSSDAASHSGGGKSSLKKTTPGTASVPHPTAPPHSIAINSIQTSANVNAIPRRPKTLQFVEDQVNKNISGQQRRSSLLAQPSELIEVLPESAKPLMTNLSNKNNRKSEADVIIDDDEVSAKIATNRPRLVRQSAFFSDEVIIEPEICPVHGSLIPGTYDDEDNDDYDGGVSDLEEIDEEEDEDDGDLNGDPTSPILRKQPGSSPTLAPINNSGSSSSGNPYSIALVIVPRRLSTISSRDTTSLQSKDESGTDSSEMNTIISGPTNVGRLGSPVRRKLSEQPIHLYVLPPATAKWHSMSSVEIQHEESPLEGNSNVAVQDGNRGDANNEARRVSFQLPKSTEKIETLKEEAGEPSSSSGGRL